MAKPAKPTIISKGLKYSVSVSLIDFDPEKIGPRTIVYEGGLAVRLKGRVYTKA